MSNYIKSLEDRYGITLNDLAKLEQIKSKSHENKAALYKKLTGFEPMSGVPLRIAVGTPPGYGVSPVAELLNKLKDAVPEEHSELRGFLYGAAAGITDQHDRLLVDFIRNTSASGAKASKLLGKLLKDLSDEDWSDLDLTAVMKQVGGKLPDPLTRDVFIQRLFKYTKDMDNITVELSLEFDDFANGAETNSFGSCYKVGKEHERAPFTLALSPDVAVMRLVNTRGALMGRAWIAFRFDSHDSGALTAFGCYGIHDRSVYKYVSDYLADRFGWSKVETIEGFVKITKSCKEPWQEKDGAYLHPKDEVVLDKQGRRFEVTSIDLDPVTHAVFEQNATKNMSIPINLPHVVCPVCGDHGPEVATQLICSECAPHSPNKAELLSGNWQVNDVPSPLADMFGLAA